MEKQRQSVAERMVDEDLMWMSATTGGQFILVNKTASLEESYIYGEYSRIDWALEAANAENAKGKRKNHLHVGIVLHEPFERLRLFTVLVDGYRVGHFFHESAANHFADAWNASGRDSSATVEIVFAWLPALRNRVGVGDVFETDAGRKYAIEVDREYPDRRPGRTVRLTEAEQREFESKRSAVKLPKAKVPA